jgi:hypothetical protein
MADYYVDRNGNISKKKKKKNEADYHVDSSGKITQLSKPTQTEDIAPVKGGNKNSVFKSGGFSDGVDGVGDFFVDLGQTVLGTAGDVGVGLGKGVTRLVEGVSDLAGYAASGVASLVGDDRLAGELKRRTQESLTDNLWKGAEDYVDQYSVLGDKADAVSEGLGQVGAIILTGGIGAGAGLGAAGTTALTTGIMGASGMGSGMSEAYAEGADDLEAVTYGAISGAADAATELIFGGLGKSVKALGLSTGLSSADDMLAKKVSGMFTKQISKNFAEFGIKAGAEGVEEVLAGIIQDVGKNVTYLEEEDQKTLWEILTDEARLEEFVVGAVTSGIAQSGVIPSLSKGSLKEANKTGRDFISGYTQNEQAVIDKEVENRVNGRDLTAKEKNKIIKEVQEDLEKGNISTDTIEALLGGETYKAYNSLVEQEKSLKKDLDALGQASNNVINVKKYDEVEMKLKQLRDGKLANARKQLTQEMDTITQKDSFLRNSYLENTKRGQKFTADTSKYEGKGKEFIQKVVDKGYVNNTTKTHDYFDLVAKVSTDTDTSFDVATNNEIMEMIKKKEGKNFDASKYKGKIVDGFFSDDGSIVLNLDSPKALNFLVGHEVTHRFEKSGRYDNLKKAIMEYAQAKKGFQEKYDATKDRYTGIYAQDNSFNDKVDKEFVADVVGEFFTDSDFIENLSTKHRNVFEWLYDEIKHLLKMATAGSKEARMLERAKHEFEKVYRAGSNNQVDFKTDTEPVRRRGGNVGSEKVGFNDVGNVGYSVSEQNADVQTLEGGAVTKYSLSTWTPDVQEKVRNNLVKAGFSDTDVDKWIKDTNGIAQAIANDKARLDFEAHDNHTMVKDNGDYYKTVEASTLCAKRLEYQGTFDAIQHRLPNTVITSDMLIELRNMMNEKGYEVPCGACYVESRRRHLGKFASEWLSKYEGEYKPTLDEVTTSDGLEKLRVEHPQAYSDFIKGMSAKRSANPKVVQLRTEYKGEILDITKSEYEKIMKIGGLRLQSFSDFETPHLLDMMQVVHDMASRKFVSQAYTKVPNFAWVMGDTNIKINLSLIPKGTGIDADGNLIFDSKEGMDFEQALRLRDRYSKNVGTITIGINDAQILKSMADDRIDYIIPFHRSGWGKHELEQMGLTSYDDYTPYQKERYIETGKGAPNIDEMSYWDFGKTGKENAETYLNLCAEKGVIPKFDKFLVNNGDGTYSLQPDGSTDGYWKTLINFKMYDNDGVGSPHEAVVPNFNMEEAYRVLDEYEGEANSLPVAKDVVDEFVAKYNNDVAPINKAETDIRYSVSDSDGNELSPAEPNNRFSLSDTVEETKDLMAVHNLSGEELIKSMKLGGLPMPSIAVLKANAVHDQYGDVSLILKKEAIDPKANRYNKVYGGDAWTPTYPRVEYMVNAKTQEAIQKKIDNLVPYDVQRTLGSIALDYDNMSERVNRNGGNATESYLHDTIMQYAFLEDTGLSVSLPTVDEKLDGSGRFDNDLVVKIAEDLGAEEIKRLNYFGISDNQSMINFLRDFANADMMEKVKSKGNDKLVAALQKNPLYTEKNFGFAQADSILRAAFRYTQQGIKKTVDRMSARTVIQNAVDFKAYEKWLNNLFANIVEREGIRNNKDLFTPSGNRRSWDALHWENTLENVVKVMKSQNQTGADAFAPASAMFAVAHKDYGSIAEIKADSGRLGRVSEDEYKELENEYGDRLAEIADSIKDPNERNRFIAMDEAASLIVDAVRSYKSKSGMLNYLRKWNKRVTSQTVEDIFSLVNDIANMPTGYFEAKPRRAVSFDEVGVFVIPNNADVKLKQELLNNGYSIAEYDPNVEGDRQRVVNQFEDLKFSLSNQNEEYAPTGNYNVYGKDVLLDTTQDIAPVAEVTETPSVDQEDDVPENVVGAPVLNESNLPKTTKENLETKLQDSNVELENIKVHRESASAAYDNKIAKLQAEYDGKKNKDTKVANRILRRIEGLKRVKADVDADYAKRISNIEDRISRTTQALDKDYTKKDSIERAYYRINKHLEADKKILEEEFNQRKAEALSEYADKNDFISRNALALYDEISSLKKGVKASKDLGYLFDHGYSWNEIKRALIDVKNYPDKVFNEDSQAEAVIREMLGRKFDSSAEVLDEIDAEYQKQVEELEAEAEQQRGKFRIAEQRRVKQAELSKWAENLIGNTATWVDKKLGISYKVNTLRRNLRDIVRDANGNQDIAKADAIYDELQGKYNLNEAKLNQESNRIKKVYADMKITDAESAYIQMLGEFRHNPDTTLTEDDVKEFYEKNKKHIDEAKVDKAINLARETYDSLLERVNEVLREQGMKEIPYRKGYFPHFTNEKQSFIAKLFNWKTQDMNIPTDIAGLTENFNPNRSWQSFNKERKSDVTDYDFLKGMDAYVRGSLDWIYHIEDIQKRRAFENHIRYVHSDQGVKNKIDALKNSNEYDADEIQKQIELVLNEAGNPLNNFVSDFRTATNTLAGKKSTLDRTMEEMTNRKIYSTMTNLSNRVAANQVVGSISSALTNFIPITQAMVQVNPVRMLDGMRSTIQSYFYDDGAIDKSAFLTNRLRQAENLSQTTWDKIIDKAGFMMEAVDNFTSQTIWRAKYNENLSNGMSENEAIKDADQFAESVIAGRSRGNMPTIFDSKNPLIKVLTAFQLEVNNQYQYMFKDAPKDIRTEHAKAKLLKGYASAAIGAYVYNALYSSIVGRDAAFDPIGIIEDLLSDLGLFGDDEEEPADIIMNLTDNLLEEVPFVGGLIGGGRIPISSAMPYDGLYEMFEGTITDIANEDWANLTNEWLNPLYYLAFPVGGGQIRKTSQGLGMFSDDHPISGSYTQSGSLRFPVEDTLVNRVQAGLFGQWANKNAQDYIENGRKPLEEKQIQEFIDVDLPIKDYWEYREGLQEQKTLEDKFDYIADLDLPVAKKNILINNIVEREEDVDMSNYDDFASYEEFDFYAKNPEKFEFLQENGISYSEYNASEESREDYNAIYTWYKNNPEKVTVSKAITDNVIEYRGYVSALNDIKADRDASGKAISGSGKAKKAAYINSLDLDYGQKIILYRTLFDSQEDKAKYNADIVRYLDSREDISYGDMVTILTELGFKVSGNKVTW